MGVRREGREIAVQALYAIELSPCQPREAINLFFESDTFKRSSKEFATDLLLGILDKSAELDARISEKSPNWSISRMAKIDLSIIRLAAFELIYKADIPKNVTLNEAIEIAKKFGSEESPSFVNGILDEIARTIAEKQ
ncbi:MAG: transcription antitermination factor NusB [Geobacteraceae bacterium]|nr:transcription antitermination factor NusB [Geobacteraceae bacterium]